MQRFVLAAVVLALVACSSPKIDTSTDEAMQASVKKVREALPEADREKFDQASGMCPATVWTASAEPRF